MNPLYILIILQALDILTTYVSMDSGKAYEANKWIASLMKKVGILPALLLVKVPLVALLWVLQPLVHPYALWGLCAVYVAVVVNNFRVMRK